MEKLPGNYIPDGAVHSFRLPMANTVSDSINILFDDLCSCGADVEPVIIEENDTGLSLYEEDTKGKKLVANVDWRTGMIHFVKRIFWRTYDQTDFDESNFRS